MLFLLETDMEKEDGHLHPSEEGQALKGQYSGKLLLHTILEWCFVLCCFFRHCFQSSVPLSHTKLSAWLEKLTDRVDLNAAE